MGGSEWQGVCSPAGRAPSSPPPPPPHTHPPLGLSPPPSPRAQLSLPLAGALALATGELGSLALLQQTHAWSVRETGGLALSSVLGVLLTATSVLCTTYNSPLATSVVGNVKDIITTAGGWWLFGGFTATPLSVSGLAISFLGAAMYSSLALQQSAAQARKEDSEPEGRGGGGEDLPSLNKQAGAPGGEGGAAPSQAWAGVTPR